MLLVLHPLRRRGVNHQQEALLGSGKLGDVVFGMRPPDMLLHRAIAFLLGKECSVSLELFLELRQNDDQRSLRRSTCEALSLVVRARQGPRGRCRLTPMQRLRQLEPSWFRSGQTTSLLASVIEKDEVKDDRGGILSATPPCAGRGVDGGWWIEALPLGCRCGGRFGYRLAGVTSYDELAPAA